MLFEIISDIEQIETFAVGSAIRERERLRKVYGKGHWRKRKGFAKVVLSDEVVVEAEIHWYEAAGFGRKEFKIKRILKEY